MGDADDRCEHCEPTATVRRWSRWLALLAAAVLSSILALAGLVYRSGESQATQASAIRELERIDAAATVERARLSVEQVRAEREAAQRWTEIRAALARIEAQLEAARSDGRRR